MKSSSLKDFIWYFLKLGALGFGGPIALCGYMHRDLVENRKWISQADYSEGMALSQLMPGPLAAQLAIYIGWVKGRNLGATLVGLAFVLPSLLMVLVLSWFYVNYGGLFWIQGAFYGIGACVMAIIALSAYKLIKKTYAHDWTLWAIGLVTASITLYSENEVLWVFIAGGVTAIIVKTPPKYALKSTVPPMVLWNLLVFFVKAGAFVFGSGLAVVPFLHGGVVVEHAWLTERQFIDAVAVAMITPGPVVITVAFIGYLVAGWAGGLVAALGIFFPCYVLTVVPAPYFRSLAKNARIKSFVEGVTAAAIGAIAAAVWIIGNKAITDMPTIVIALLSLLALLKFKKLPEPVLILIAGAAGVGLRANL